MVLVDLLVPVQGSGCVAPWWLLADSFRGDGFYFSYAALFFFLIGFFGWVRTCWWVGHDTKTAKMPVDLWNHVVLLLGIVGLLFFWAVSSFFGAYLLLVLFCFGPALAYVFLRNQKVPADRRVLTPDHFRKLYNRLLRRQEERRVEEDKPARLPIRFMGRNTDTDTTSLVSRVESSKGYKAALQLVYDALQRRSTDIHLEPTKSEMTVRYRIDGILHAAPSLPKTLGDPVVNIFKVLAGLDITEKRKPQDGSFSAEIDGRTVDFRAATAGSVIGEKMAMRVLDTAKQILDLEKLGMRESMRDVLHRLVTQPHGMMIVCGPTGSGKSTTLYACLNEIDRLQCNVITLENPVEYNLQHVTQIEINPKAGKTFAGELRSCLRQDPDVLLVGEIRDKETAEAACQAAQTGHMVLSTVHANDSVTAVARLIDLGVPPYLVSNALSAVLGQRLVRVLCPKCKVAYKPNPEMLKKANLPPDRIKQFYRPPEEGELKKPCKRCGNTGYHGRTGVFELLVITDSIRELVREAPNLNAIRQEAVKNGMKSLQEDGLRQVIEGITSIQELLRVCK